MRPDTSDRINDLSLTRLSLRVDRGLYQQQKLHLTIADTFVTTWELS